MVWALQLLSFMMRPLMTLALMVLSLDMIGCLPNRGTLPERTWRSETPEATCAIESMLDPHDSSHWNAVSREAFERALDRGELPVVSALGCRVDVLPRCHAKANVRREGRRVELESRTVTARDVEGECTGATHVVRSASMNTSRLPEHVELAPLSLQGFDLTGMWIGAMRQPNGPYEVYDVTLDLVQQGDRVTGETRIVTVDHAYWGRLRFEGRLQGNTLFFADVEIVEDNLGIFLEWCAKGGYMSVDPRDERLSGPWKAGMHAGRPGAATRLRSSRRSARPRTNPEMVSLVPRIGRPNGQFKIRPCQRFPEKKLPSAQNPAGSARTLS